MAQSSITVTPPNPTPPTNMSFVGATPPTDPAQPYADDGAAGTATAFAAKTAAAGSGTSADHEGRGTETVVTATSVNPSPAGQTQMFSCLGNYTNAPNQQHASSLSPAGNPTISGLVPASTASGTGTTGLTVNGTNFTKQSVVYVNGVAQVTSFVSSVQLIVNAAPKKATAGTLPVKVMTGGVVETAPTNWTFT